MSIPRERREGDAHVIRLGQRRTVGTDPSIVASRTCEAERRSTPSPRSPLFDRDHLRVEDGHSVESAPGRVRLRQWLDLLASAGLVDSSRSVASSPSTITQRPGQVGPDRLVQSRRRQRLHAGRFWGAHTGPNPTDRAKSGCKRHVVTDAQGIPLVVQVTPANVNDCTPAIELLDSIPPIQGPHGAPRSRPDLYQGDRAYGTKDNIAAVRARRIRCQLALMNNRNHGSGLGRFRYVVERTLAWFGHNRRLKLCYERTREHFQAFHDLAAALICANRLRSLKLVLH